MDRIGLAVLFTVLSYSVLTLYDSLAFRYIHRPMPYRKIAFGSFLGYVFSHNIGLSVVGASAVRFRLYGSVSENRILPPVSMPCKYMEKQT